MIPNFDVAVNVLSRCRFFSLSLKEDVLHCFLVNAVNLLFKFSDYFPNYWKFKILHNLYMQSHVCGSGVDLR